MAQLFNLPIELVFNNPKSLYLLIVLPLLILIYFGSMSYRERRAINFPNFEALQRTGVTEMHSKNIFYLYSFLICTLMIILTLCGTNLVLITDTSDFSYVIAIDNSQSMQATDLSPNRLEMSKIAAIDFVNKLPLGVKVGIISFSGEVQILSELETSKPTLDSIIDKVEFSQTSGTNINDAIIAGNQLFKNEKLKSIIILSDGQINIGNITDTIDYAKDNGIIVNTIALGTATGGETPLGFTSKTDIEILKAISFNTNGKFFSITSSSEKEVPFNEILNNTQGKVKINLANYMLTIALVILLLFWISYNFRFRNFP